ncbi:radical SAM family heme chaperone HemW [Desulfofundulus thermosubterraneus]|uniref:Heme chaperone HemW n=1 Tax=Desulfofundulus thermosubterraneus DSM 16057 TaxID=1121432 RepID=A0A1M6ABB9_9FIRM|nr:radical SAM family heme chaperone HemW [Desulfofundulus thermosubterraneus]SHI33814.1 oxygen-independent coproporphyrinogen-3 oxidase [Desulfofundulus thermosubterraneus DSM 16057]
MAISLYIHVPFCLRKCRYCDFVSYTYDPEAARRYRVALLREMALYHERLAPQERQLKTIFIGGGTPTCLPQGELVAILEGCYRYFQWLSGVEVTIEANPGTVDLPKLRALRAAGVNRLSLGVQTCSDRFLKLLGRVHDFSQAVEAVQLARRAGFDNLNLDLIFAIPGQTVAEWLHCLDKILTLRPEHISAYSLQIEEGTPLARAVAEGSVLPCDEETDLAMYREVINFLAARGYEHYEVSNFARPGHRCRHNLTYWHNEPYLGLGPAAHSYLRGERLYNTASLEEYEARLLSGELPVAGREKLSRATMMAETVFLGLRLIEGLDLEKFAACFGENIEEVFGEQIIKLRRAGLLEIHSGRLRLTFRGLPLANAVFREFVLP